jgi:amidase
MDLAFRSASALARALRGRKIGCLELLDAYLARVERYNPKLNAIIWQDRAGARKRAKAADRALAKGEIWGPLHGVPMTVKESFDVAGAPTTWGDPVLASNIAKTDALAVGRFKAAGATLFGKTNVPLMLADWQSFNAVYGTTNNPWDVTRVPGGSSGGSAAALAAGLTGLEAGSDIGASIRNPAHYCGVFGHKPSWGICSPRGHALPGKVAAGDISAIGPLARSAADLRLALGVMAGPDAVDGAGWRLALPKPRKIRYRDMKIALVLNDPVSEVDASVQERLAHLAAFLRKQGAKVDERARPAIDTAEAQKVYVMLLRAATSGRQSDAQHAANAKVAASLARDDESYYARMTRANAMSHRDWLGWNERRHQMRLAWAAFFEDYDFVLCPTAASAAFPHDHAGERHQRTILVNGRRVPTTDQIFWAGYSCAFFLPGTVAPCGRTKEGLPVGVQIVGAQYADLACIALAERLERDYEHGAFVAPPGYA